MKSVIKKYHYENSEIQRVQIVTLDDWRDLDFLMPKPYEKAYSHMADIYRDYVIPKASFLFGTLYFYTIPEDMELPFACVHKDRFIDSKIFLKKEYKNEKGKSFLKELDKRGCLRIVKGKRPSKVSFLPFRDTLGYLSESEKESPLRVNSSFFTFDVFDCPTPYDSHGTPLGLMVKDGKILNPPQYGREALLVDKEGNVRIRKISLKDITISIKGKIYERPKYKKTPKGKGKDVFIIRNRVVDVKGGGGHIVPASGYILHTEEDVEIGDTVEYSGLEDCIFALQCGNSIVIDGVKTEKFLSPFYNIRKLESVSYPPSLYPLNFEKDRAPRIALGEDQDHHPVLIWAEGPGKDSYTAGKDSCGASLSELGDILMDLGIRNAVNLDGGGSAEIFYKGKRELKVSDRDIEKGKEKERPIPIGLYVHK